MKITQQNTIDKLSFLMVNAWTIINYPQCPSISRVTMINFTDNNTQITTVNQCYIVNKCTST